MKTIGGDGFEGQVRQLNPVRSGGVRNPLRQGLIQATRSSPQKPAQGLR